MNKVTGLRTAALAAGLLGAVAIAAPATAQMRTHTGIWHGSFHSGWHGPTARVGAWHGGWHGWRGGTWHGRSWHPGWRGGVAVGFYGGYPYYGYPYGYYPYGGYYGDGYYGDAYNYCDDPYDDDGDCDGDY